MAVQTRSPIARGNWVDIGNESKEQITRSKGRRGWRTSVKWRTDEWRRDLVVAFVSAMVDRGLKQRGVEAHSDVRTERDFTALARDARNVLDNPTSTLDLFDPLPLSLSSHPITTMFK